MAMRAALLATLMVMYVSANSEEAAHLERGLLEESLVETLLQQDAAPGGQTAAPGGPGPTTSKTPGANPSVIHGKPNNAPPQMHMKNVRQLPGKSMKAVGYPNKRRKKGNAGKKLVNSEPKVDTTGHSAEDRIYPGGGKMNAKDVHQMVSEVRPLLDMAATSKKFRQEREQQAFERRNAANKKLIHAMKQPTKGKGLLNGKLEHDIGVARGNLLNCKNKLAKCKGGTRLGEEGGPVKQVKTTAIQDDRKSRGVRDPAAREKAKPNTTRFKRTAQQRYIHKQKKLVMFENAPGWKKAEDRLPAKYVHKITEEANRLITRSKRFEDQENKQNAKAIVEADAKARDAASAIAQSKEAKREAEKPESTANVTKEYTKVNTELFQCMKEVQAKCK